MEAPLPPMVVLPLTQHIGAPNEPLVKVGDQVKVGQKIADTKAFVAAPVHASVSGKVVAIEPRPVAAGGTALAIVIEREGDELFPDLKPLGKPWDLSPQALRDGMREAGLIGMGGAGFPTHVKYAPPAGKKIECVILNAAECEPFLTCDHRLLCERTELVLNGFLGMMRAAEAKQGYIGIEENKPDAIEILREAVKRLGVPIEVAVLKAKYPQGEERMLIKAILGREVPSGGLPVDVGAVVNNVATAAAFGEYLLQGIPLVSRVMTMTGRVAEPGNVRVRLGMLLSEAVKVCGGLKGEIAKLIYGGPMTGPTGFSLDVPVTKAMSGLLVLGPEDVKNAPPTNCIRCGFCLRACPYGLVPQFMAGFIELGQYDKAEAIGLMDCRECGSCAFVCPSRRLLTQQFKEAKLAVMKKRREEQAKQEAASGKGVGKVG